MKYIILFLLLFPLFSNAQVSDKISFQAVVYDNQNKLVVNRNVGVRMSIISGSIDGTTVYQETHMVTTSGTGLFTLQLGGGTPTIGTYSGINWGAASHFLKREFDINGGTNYQIMGIGEILSVPYAIYSTSAKNLYPNIEIGMDTFGGIVFHIERYSNKTIGLVVSKSETTAVWSNSLTLVGADSHTDGQYNTNKMIDSPAKDYVTGLNEGGFTDWYLPAFYELTALVNNTFTVNKMAESLGFMPLLGLDNGGRVICYHSSTEFNSTTNEHFSTRYSWGAKSKNETSFTCKVRAIRKFEINH
jgi:hypothetical protein